MSDPTKYEPKVGIVSTGSSPSGQVLLTAQKQQADVEKWLDSQQARERWRPPGTFADIARSVFDAADPCVRFHRLPHGKGLPLPAYATAGAAGMDLYAAADVEIPPGGRALVGTGFAIEIPPGFEAQIRPRSGLAFHKGVTVLNSPGTIDSDYRGEVKVLLVNLSGGTYHCHWGYDRIAQLVIAPVSRLKIEEAEQLSETERGAGGFGSTGS